MPRKRITKESEAMWAIGFGDSPGSVGVGRQGGDSPCRVCVRVCVCVCVCARVCVWGMKGRRVPHLEPIAADFDQRHLRAVETGSEEASCATAVQRQWTAREQAR